MATISDDLGVWNQLGSLQPILQDWLEFPVVSDGAKNTFRLEVVSLDPENINSYLLIRSRFQSSLTNQVEQSIRIYPKSHLEEKLLFQLPLNRDLFENSVFTRKIEVRKVYIRTRYLGITMDTNYTIRLEELW